jgi:hypothetical protein
VLATAPEPITINFNFMKKYLVYSALAACLLQACSSQVYNNQGFVSSHNLTGKKVAILPVEVEFTGNLPKGYSIGDKMAAEDTESTAIQNLIYSEYLYKAGSGSKKRHAVELINTDQINSRLREKGIDVREAWSMNPDSLGKMVGADMVLKVHVKKNRIMSESAAFGIDVATNVIGGLLSKGTNNSTSVSPGNTKTYTINIDATLSDVNSSTVITKFSRQGDASWSQSPESVVKSTGKKIVRKGVVYAQE